MWKWFLAVFVILALMCGGLGFFVFGTEGGRQMTQGFRPGNKQTEVRLDAVKRGKLAKVISELLSATC